jgi:hypothetical protein
LEKKHQQQIENLKLIHEKKLNEMKEKFNENEQDQELSQTKRNNYQNRQ